MAQEKRYYHLIDSLRGFALIHMLFFHFFYDYFVIFGRNPHWYSIPAVRVWQHFICISFILISGISMHFSRNNYKRGLLLNVYGLVITAVTAFFMPSELVIFGILNLLGCSILVLEPVRKVLKHLPAATSLYVCLILFLLTHSVPQGYIGIGQYVFMRLPGALYATPLTAGLGFPSPSFYSSDYFPLIPWFFLFSAGYFLWPILYAATQGQTNVKKRELLTCKLPLLSYLGTKSIWIYLAHQPILYLIALLLSPGRS